MSGDERPTTVWRGLRGNPLRFPLSRWPWRSLAYVATGIALGFVWTALVVLLAFVGAVLTPLVVGVGMLACVPLSAIALAAAERRRLRWIDPRPAPSPHAAPPAPGWYRWVRFRLREPATWRELGYGMLNALLSAADFVIGFVVIVGVGFHALAPELVDHGDQIQYGSLLTIDTMDEAWLSALLSVPLLLLGLYILTVLAGARAALARALLVRPPAEALGERLVEVTASRARLADAFEAERRRIERDLHDGAQQRLTGLIMTLGLARLDGDPGLIGKAQDEARAALTELRDLVRGIHPSVLTDRGLPAAVESLAERSPVPVKVDVELPARPPEAIESAAYFVIAEALANVAKHSGADRVMVLVRAAGGRLLVEVRDDGAGGADPGGSGLQGLADRVAVHDGTVRLSSPPGGPTIVRVELPCAS